MNQYQPIYVIIILIIIIITVINTVNATKKNVYFKVQRVPSKSVILP